MGMGTMADCSWATHVVFGHGNDAWHVALKLDDMVSEDANGVKTYREWTDVMASVLDPDGDDEPMMVHVHPNGSMWADVEPGETWEVVPKGWA